jgi:hypothetical protein
LETPEKSGSRESTQFIFAHISGIVNALAKPLST